MTAARPGEDPTDDTDAEFDRIVAGIKGRMAWDTDADGLDAAAVSAGPSAPIGPTGTADHPGALEGADLEDHHEHEDTAEGRRQRREERRAERAAELAEFQAAKIERHNEMLFDDEHFVPPEPPPLPRPRARTVWAAVLILAGVLLMVGPQVLAISGNATLLLGLVLVVGGLVLLVAGLRSSHGDPRDADGWDDGARL